MNFCPRGRLIALDCYPRRWLAEMDCPLHEWALDRNRRFFDDSNRKKNLGRSPGWGARVSRAKPEYWGRSPRVKPEIQRGRGLGRGLCEPLPRKYLKIQTWNSTILVSAVKIKKMCTKRTVAYQFLEQNNNILSHTSATIANTIICPLLVTMQCLLLFKGWQIGLVSALVPS